jgi:hypothetical protein
LIVPPEDLTTVLMAFMRRPPIIIDLLEMTSSISLYESLKTKLADIL